MKSRKRTQAIILVTGFVIRWMLGSAAFGANFPHHLWANAQSMTVAHRSSEMMGHPKSASITLVTQLSHKLHLSLNRCLTIVSNAVSCVLPKECSLTLPTFPLLNEFIVIPPDRPPVFSSPLVL